MTRQCFIFAGEASGDFLGSRLMQAIGSQFVFQGVGGPQMLAAGLSPILPFDRFGQMGLSAILKNFFRLRRDFYFLLEHVLKQKPDLVLCIDFPGWNLRFGAALRKKGFLGRIVQYVSPSVWAHGKRRMQKIADTFDLLLTLYPFEPPLFAHTPLSVAFVGHPLIETLPVTLRKASSKPPCIALFPGSREQEVIRHAPLFLQAAALLHEKYPEVQFSISCLTDSFRPWLEKSALLYAPRIFDQLQIVPNMQKESLLKRASLAIAKSGTVTLELGLHQIPTLAVYSLSYWDFLFAKYLMRLKLPFYCLVNLLAEKEVFPECIGPNITPETIAQRAGSIWQDLMVQKNIIEGCVALREQLQSPLSVRGIRLSPSETAAHYIEALF